MKVLPSATIKKQSVQTTIDILLDYCKLVTYCLRAALHNLLLA